MTGMAEIRRNEAEGAKLQRRKKKTIKRRKKGLFRNDPNYLLGVQKNVEQEVLVLRERLEQGIVPEHKASRDEARLKTLLSKSLPGIRARLSLAQQGVRIGG